MPSKRQVASGKGDTGYEDIAGEGLALDEYALASPMDTRWQLLNYLKATNLPLGLIANFGMPKLDESAI